MKRTGRTMQLFTVLALIFGSLVAIIPRTDASSGAEIDRAARSALRNPYAINPKAKAIGSRAAAVLVFPSVRKGGFLVAAQHGDGALISGGRITGYYQTLAASYGLQAVSRSFVMRFSS